MPLDVLEVLELLELAPSDFGLGAAGLSAAGLSAAGVELFDELEDEDFSASMAFLRDSEG